jgi:L,D-transpeptidase ErfK/SrfK
MVLANPGVDPWLPGVGREVVVPTEFVLPAAPHQGIVVNVASMRLFYFPPHKKGESQVLYTYPIGIGREGWKTREGTTTVISHTKDPVWVVPKSVREEHARDGDKLPAEVPPGPDNPLGKPVGTQVTIVNQPYVFGWRGDTLYLQAYAVMEDDTRDWAKHRERLLMPVLDAKARQQVTAQSQWGNIDELAQAPRGVPSPVQAGAKGVDAEVEQAVLVEDTLPQGSNWEGETESPSAQPVNDLMGKQISE